MESETPETLKIRQRYFVRAGIAVVVATFAFSAASAAWPSPVSNPPRSVWVLLVVSVAVIAVPYLTMFNPARFANPRKTLTGEPLTKELAARSLSPLAAALSLAPSGFGGATVRLTESFGFFFFFLPLTLLAGVAYWHRMANIVRVIPKPSEENTNV